MPAVVLGLAVANALAADCPGNPNALGTGRVLALDPRELPRIGTIQYARSLPLRDKEVVLTFDDGPMPPYSNRVLEVLAEQCVKANYFIIGRMARGYPDLLRRIHAAGHVIGTHSQNHPLAFERMPLAAVQAEIEQGIASVTAALANRQAVAPFFRIPGLLRAPQVESYLQTRGLATFSADVVADDWKHLTAAEVVRRAIARLEEKGKGILLLHDIQPATALALPELLRQLKAHGYRVVQVVPASRETPAAVAAKEPPAAGPLEAPAVAAPRARQTAETETKATASMPPETATQARASLPDEKQPTARLRNAAPVFEIPRQPVRPFAAELKPPFSAVSPAKLVAIEPGGWPPAVGVPVPAAGGVGVSALPRSGPTPDGRFQPTR
jgi:peptidoglycan/xylan/chitin deacetylase (PgdA/CDA1 family)